MKNLLKNILIKNKKGTTMVEAAIILPLVILSVMAMIYLLINIYSTVALQSHMHILLREESGLKSGMVKYEIVDGHKRDKIRKKAEASQIDISSHRQIPFEVLEAQKTSVYTTNMIIKKAPRKKTYGKSFVYNESDIVRFKRIVSIN